MSIQQGRRKGTSQVDTSYFAYRKLGIVCKHQTECGCYNRISSNNSNKIC